MGAPLNLLDGLAVEIQWEFTYSPGAQSFRLLEGLGLGRSCG
jgi:hypothetical protein